MFFKKEEKLNYEIVDPSRTSIIVLRNSAELGKITWDFDNHLYKFTGNNISLEDMRELIEAITKLNKTSELPQWLAWKKI